MHPISYNRVERPWVLSIPDLSRSIVSQRGGGGVKPMHRGETRRESFSCQATPWRSTVRTQRSAEGHPRYYVSDDPVPTTRDESSPLTKPLLGHFHKPVHRGTVFLPKNLLPLLYLCRLFASVPRSFLLPFQSICVPSSDSGAENSVFEDSCDHSGNGTTGMRK